MAGEAGDGVHARGLERVERHRRQEGGEAPGQHDFARPRGAEEEHIMGRTPAYHFASPVPLGMPMDPLMNLLARQAHGQGSGQAQR